MSTEDSPEAELDALKARVAELLEEREHLRDRLAYATKLAAEDPLTGVKNRREAEIYLTAQLELGKRSGAVHSVALIDFDDFKHLNTVGGQQFGDDVLRQVISRLQSKLRGSDMLARIGGEEFLIILPNTSEFDAYETVQRVISEVQSELTFERHGVIEKVTMSVGVASSADTNEMDKLIEMANDAERAAKRDGKARVYLNVCGAILDSREAKELMESPDMLGVIRRYREGRIQVMKDRREVPFSHFLKTVRVLEEANVSGAQTHGDFTIRTIGGDPGPVFAAYLRAPDEPVLSPVRDTAAQLLDGLHSSSLTAFPNSHELWLSPESKLNFLNLLLTHACCMKCVYCTQEHRDEQWVLSEEDWMRAIDEATEQGARKGVILSLTGGEPLVKKELVLHLLCHARDRGMYITMNTNAMLFDPSLGGKTSDMAAAVLSTGISALNISLDSQVPGIEDQIVRTPGAFGHIISGLKAVARIRSDYPLKRVTLNHVLTRDNFRSLPLFVEYLCTIREHEHPALFGDINPLPVKEAPGLYLRLEELHEFNTQILPRLIYLARKYHLPLFEAKIQRIFAANVMGEDERMYRYDAATRGVYCSLSDMSTLPCATAMTSATILPDGKVFPCTYHREAREGSEGRLYLGNIRDKSMAEMRQIFFMTLRRLPRNGHGGVNPICASLCGPDLKGLNGGVREVLRKAGAIR